MRTWAPLSEAEEKGAVDIGNDEGPRLGPGEVEDAIAAPDDRAGPTRRANTSQAHGLSMLTSLPERWLTPITGSPAASRGLSARKMIRPLPGDCTGTRSMETKEALALAR